MTPELRDLIAPGAGVWWSQTSAEPTPLVHALLDLAPELVDVTAFIGMTWDKRVATQLPPQIRALSYGALGDLRHLSAAGRLEVVPCHFSNLPRLFAQGRLPHDVGLIQVSPPDADGNCSLGTGVDYVADAIAHTPVLIAEVNHQMPATVGSVRLPLSRFAATVETDRPLLQAPERSPGAVELAIAGHVADLVEDGDTIQVGVGVIPSAILDALSGHRDLGLHSGLISDPVLRLVQAGALTGARKEIDPGMMVTGAALGSTELYACLGDLPVQFRPVSYTHAPTTLARLRSLVSINSAIEVDLTGQAGSEVRGTTYVGAIGGQTDFSRAAAQTGARSIIVLPATSKGKSTIKAHLEFGAMSTSRADIDVVVTEHGAAHLTGCSLPERARRLIEVAAPEHREQLERSAQVDRAAVPTR
ncbi:acetyl-CoA hydrolase/transferase family protein [Kribbia dieselivorans]|uniref:acetyl-CoA hydrolase/transferase family protein n=1 Tax=Kribbia dieselivorans TaxID=331526 RepID=UPI00083898EC|nr:acetyl-CoA hydrolase/transferase C-terminal domain-containing protein [Kribbia dieselivorans]